MKTIALVTQKGGCGKTTLATNLAVAAWQEGAKVMILDADPQGTATAWYESRDADGPELVAVAGGEIERAVALFSGKGFDLVFIDTPARAEPVNAEAARAADYCIVPCRPTLPDMRAQKATVASIEGIGRKACFVLTHVPPRGSREQEAARGLAVLGLAVAPVLVGYRAAYPDAYAKGQSVTEYEAEGKASIEMRGLWEWISKRLSRG